MRFVKGVVVGVLALIVLLVAVSFLLPRETTVERAVLIEAPAEAIFPHVNSLKATENWSPWLARDPDVELSYSGPESGVGSQLDWASENPQVGIGSQIITASNSNERVETALDFGQMGTANAWFDLEPEGAGTRVTWGFVSDNGMNPMARWMGLMLDTWVGGDYEAGLNNLKALVEAS